MLFDMELQFKINMSLPDQKVMEPHIKTSVRKKINHILIIKEHYFIGYYILYFKIIIQNKYKIFAFVLWMTKATYAVSFI